MRTDLEKGPGEFPYDARWMCYIEVFNDGTVQQMTVNKTEANKTLQRLKSGESKLYCAWPGEYRTDLFTIDNIKAFEEAFAFKR